MNIFDFQRITIEHQYSVHIFALTNANSIKYGLLTFIISKLCVTRVQFLYIHYQQEKYCV